MGFNDFGLLVLRVIVGLVFAAHGAQKAFGWWSGPGFPKWRAAIAGMGFRPVGLWAVASVGAELAGGVLLIAGFLTPLVAAFLVAQSIVIIGQVHLRNGFWNGGSGYEFPLTLAAGAFALATTGSGSISVDRAIGFSLTAPQSAALLVIAVLGAVAALAVPRLLPRATAAPQGR